MGMDIDAIVADIDFLCGTTSATYPTGDKERNINTAYHDVARLIWESDGSWNFVDSGDTSTPNLATLTMGHASASYTVPTTAIRIDQIEVKDANGDWTKLTYKSYEDLYQSPEEYLSSAGLPINYALEGNEIRLFPPPHSASVTLSSGLAVRLDPEVTELRISASTTTPGIPSAFRKIVSYAAAIDFSQDRKQIELWMTHKARLERGLVRFYGHRGSEAKKVIKPRHSRRWRKYT